MSATESKSTLGMERPTLVVVQSLVIAGFILLVGFIIRWLASHIKNASSEKSKPFFNLFSKFYSRIAISDGTELERSIGLVRRIHFCLFCCSAALKNAPCIHSNPKIKHHVKNIKSNLLCEALMLTILKSSNKIFRIFSFINLKNHWDNGIKIWQVQSEPCSWYYLILWLRVDNTWSMGLREETTTQEPKD